MICLSSPIGRGVALRTQRFWVQAPRKARYDGLAERLKALRCKRSLKDAVVQIHHPSQCRVAARRQSGLETRAIREKMKFRHFTLRFNNHNHY